MTPELTYKAVSIKDNPPTKGWHVCVNPSSPQMLRVSYYSGSKKRFTPDRPELTHYLVLASFATPAGDGDKYAQLMETLRLTKQRIEGFMDGTLSEVREFYLRMTIEGIDETLNIWEEEKPLPAPPVK